MTDRIDFGAEPWQAIPRRVLRDPNLTARAKGGLVTLLSHEEGWVRSCIAMLQRECKCGAKQAQAIMAELRELGYAELVTERVDNRIRRHYVISAVPKGPGSQADFTAALSSTVPTAYEPDRTAQGAVVVDPPDVDPQEEQSQELVLSSASPFDEWYAAYPRHEKPREARAAFERALKRADLDTLIRGALRYRADPNREDGYTAHPATWLNSDSWLNDPLPARMNGKARSVSNILAMADQAERNQLP